MATIKVPMESQSPGLSEAKIAAAERALGLEFPDAYRTFLRSTNGCELEDAVFYLPRSPGHPKGYMAEVRELMGIGPGAAGQDLVSWHKDFGHRLPQGGFEFAGDSGGNAFVAFTQGPRRGEVAFVEHETGESTTLTKSMDDFLDHLVPADAPEVLADFPPVVGHAVKIVARKAKGGAKRTAAKKAATRKVAARKIVAKKVAPKAKKAAARKVTARKIVAKKVAPKAKKAASRKVAAKQTATKKPVKKKTAR